MGPALLLINEKGTRLMRRIALLAASVCGAVALVAGTAGAAGNAYHADMSADQEVPEKGPEGATGTADLTIDQAGGQVCYKLAYQGITQPVAGHIHEGAAGVAGPVAVNLDLQPGRNEACVPGDPAVLSKIEANPAGFYVNLHTADHQKGAMRGQLAKV